MKGQQLTFLLVLFCSACHVTMSVNKLLKRIVAPELSEEEIQKLQRVDDMAAHLHDYTHGINGDPLLAFAITISALVHDADHPGVSNTRLIEEEPDLAAKYHNKSVAEQNSLDIAWDILMEDEFQELRRVLFPTQFELMRFRQLIVNVVLGKWGADVTCVCVDEVDYQTNNPCSSLNNSDGHYGQGAQRPSKAQMGTSILRRRAARGKQGHKLASNNCH